jgi:hypothetical protein
MKANSMNRQQWALAALLGVALLATGPNTARADQGKWWNPGHGGTPPGQAKKQATARVVAPTYYPPANHVVVGGPRYYRAYRGGRVYRDVVTVRRGYHGPAHWGPGTQVYRYYAYPTYYYPTRTVYVRPVRFYLSAGAVTGSGVSFSIGYASPAYVYGCNFCGAEFSTYGAYHTHVVGCAAHPAGYRVVTQDWGNDWPGNDGYGHDHWAEE